MGLLHRLYARNAPAVWEVENRLFRRLGLARPPLAVQWIATRRCNLTCPHCYSEAGRHPVGPDELTTDEVERHLLDELVALDRPELVLAGGEPLVRPDLQAILTGLAARSIPWAMHTHGGLVERLADVLALHPPTMVAVSLDGPREAHDRFRGRPGSFDAALRAIPVLHRIGCPEVVVGTTVHRGNADLLPRLWPTVLASGADSWGLHLFVPEGRGETNRHLFPRPDQLRRVAAFARRKRQVFRVELDNEWGSAGDDDIFYRDDPFLCGAGRISCVVTATGEVVPCTTTDPAESEGNIRQRPLSRLWAEGFDRFREGGHGDCSDGRECWLQARNDNACRHLAFGRRALEAEVTA